VQQGITLLLINLDGNTTFHVRVSTENGSSSLMTSTTPENQSPRTKFAVNRKVTREEYHLTAKDGDLHSRTMLLNGKTLGVDSNGDIPPLEPIHVNESDPIAIAPFSIVFAQIPYINFSACK
jgi:heparanase 1